MSLSMIVKPAAAGAAAYALDKYVLKETNNQRSMYFGGAVAGATLASSIVTPMLPAFIPNILPDGFDERTLSQRIVEVGLSTGAAWYVNAKVLNNAYSRDDMMKRLAVCAAAAYVGEYVDDYYNGRPLSFFS